MEFITTILKSLNKKLIWDDWSTCSLKYHQQRNLKIWNENSGCIDINFLIYILNKAGHNIQMIPRCKKYN